VEILVAIKQVVDPELPPRLFAIDPVAKRQVREGRPLVPSVYDLHALEVALQLKEHHGGRIVVVSVGEPSAEKVLRRALAMGADRAVFVDARGIDDVDPLGIAHAISTVAREENASLILCGCQSGDWGWEQTGPFIAEILGFPCVTFVAAVSLEGTALRVVRRIEGGTEELEVILPAVVTVMSAPENIPRLPTIRAVLEAERQEIRVVDQSVLMGGAPLSSFILEDVLLPKRHTKCEFVQGETPEELARNLVERLQALGVV